MTGKRVYKRRDQLMDSYAEIIEGGSNSAPFMANVSQHGYSSQSLEDINSSRYWAQQAEYWAEIAEGHASDAASSATNSENSAIASEASAIASELSRLAAEDAAFRAAEAETECNRILETVEDLIEGIEDVDDAVAEAKQARDEAVASASLAESYATSASASATAAAGSASTASSAATRAEDAAEVLETMTAEATTLIPGSDATADWDNTTGTMSFGIPSGPQGDKGDTGEPGTGITYMGLEEFDNIFITSTPTVGDMYIISDEGAGDGGAHTMPNQGTDQDGTLAYQGDGLAYANDNTWTLLSIGVDFTEDLEFGGNITLDSDYAFRFRYGAAEGEFINGLRANLTRAVIGDGVALGNLPEGYPLYIAMQDATDFKLVERFLDPGNDEVPLPTATYDVLSTKNGVSKTGNVSESITGNKTFPSTVTLQGFEGSASGAAIHYLPTTPTGGESFLTQLRGGSSDTVHWLGAAGGLMTYSTGVPDAQIRRLNFSAAGISQPGDQNTGADYLTKKEYVDSEIDENVNHLQAYQSNTGASFDSPSHYKDGLIHHILGTADGPGTNSHHGLWIAHSPADTNFGTQLVFRNGRAYIRSEESGTFTTWREFINSTSDQTLAGNKTFASNISIAPTTPTADGHAVRKDYVDNKFSTLEYATITPGTDLDALITSAKYFIVSGLNKPSNSSNQGIVEIVNQQSITSQTYSEWNSLFDKQWYRTRSAAGEWTSWKEYITSGGNQTLGGRKTFTTQISQEVAASANWDLMRKQEVEALDTATNARITTNTTNIGTNTSGVARADAHIAATASHVSTADRTAWNAGDESTAGSAAKVAAHAAVGSTATFGHVRVVVTGNSMQIFTAS